VPTNRSTVRASCRGGDTSSGVVDGDVGGPVARPGAGGWQGGRVYPRFSARQQPGGQMAWTGESTAVVRSFGIAVGGGRSGGDTAESDPMPAAGRVPFRPRNVANPMTGCRMRQDCRSSRGANRRSREERQGRNVLGTWQVRADGQVSFNGGRPGSGRATEMSVEGRTLENPKRGVRSNPESPRNQRLAPVASREVNRWQRSRADARYLSRLRRRGKGHEGPVPGRIVPGT
jgi:hypothetical protein